MASQNQPQQDLTLSEKMKIVQYLAIFPAITIMVFMRRRVGFRLLKPSWLLGMAMFLWFISGVCNINFLIFHPAGEIFDKFPLLMLAAAFLQRYHRWRELCNGVRWHTLSPGISYFELLPLPAFFRSQRRIYRFLDPIGCFIFSMFFGVFISEPLARWIAFSSIWLFIYEQTLYEKQLDRDLDILDGLVVAEVHEETVEHFAGPQPDENDRTLQDTAGIPTGVAYDIHRQIETRRARQTAAEEKSKAQALARQIVELKLATGMMPHAPARTVVELPMALAEVASTREATQPAVPEPAPKKPLPPDNLVPEEP